MAAISEDASKRITSLRFLLLLFVMVKHNAIVKDIFFQNLPFSEPKIVTFIKEFFANGLGELAVPVFFIFSAFLLASSSDSYITKLKKRFHSIFLPYTIWTVMYFGAWLVLKKLSILSGTVNPCMDWHEWTFRDYVMRFLGYFHMMRFPFVGSFWFLRDLMVLVIFSPVLMVSTKKLPVITIITIFLAYFFNVLPPLLMRQSLFYFEIGLIFAIYKIDFFALSDKVCWPDLLIAFIIGFIFVFEANCKACETIQDSLPFFLFLFSGIILLLKSSKLISENEKSFAIAQKLAPFTFFVYAIHTPILKEFVKKMTLMSGLPAFLQFLTACILDIGLSLLIAVIFRKYFPIVFAFLSGGKRDK